MHKDLTQAGRKQIDATVKALVEVLHESGDSLALAREHASDAFDREAERVDAV